MNQKEKTLSENFKTLYNPTTALEKQQRAQQVRDISFFVLTTALVFFFKDKVMDSIENLSKNL